MEISESVLKCLQSSLYQFKDALTELQPKVLLCFYRCCVTRGSTTWGCWTSWALTLWSSCCPPGFWWTSLCFWWMETWWVAVRVWRELASVTVSFIWRNSFRLRRMFRGPWVPLSCCSSVGSAILLRTSSPSVYSTSSARSATPSPTPPRGSWSSASRC